MIERGKADWEKLTSEQRAVVEEIRARNRTPEALARDECDVAAVEAEFPPLKPKESGDGREA
jgi:hypothetical protein